MQSNEEPQYLIWVYEMLGKFCSRWINRLSVASSLMKNSLVFPNLLETKCGQLELNYWCASDEVAKNNTKSMFKIQILVQDN